jgi:hypothetical protein
MARAVRKTRSYYQCGMCLALPLYNFKHVLEENIDNAMVSMNHKNGSIHRLFSIRRMTCKYRQK